MHEAAVGCLIHLWAGLERVLSLVVFSTSTVVLQLYFLLELQHLASDHQGVLSLVAFSTSTIVLQLYFLLDLQHLTSVVAPVATVTQAPTMRPTQTESRARAPVLAPAAA